MTSIRRVLSLFFLAVLAGCSSNAAGPLGLQTDPFDGYFADPAFGTLELRPIGSDRYLGSIATDSAPFPVQFRKFGDVLRGTVTHGGVSVPAAIETAGDGLTFNTADYRSPKLRRFASPEAYQQWRSTQPAAPATRHVLTTRPS